MRKSQEVIEKAYGNIPKEVGFGIAMFDFLELRGVRYYFWKVVRYFTR